MIDSIYGLSFVWQKVNIWTNTDKCQIDPLRMNFSEKLIQEDAIENVVHFVRTDMCFIYYVTWRKIRVSCIHPPTHTHSVPNISMVHFQLDIIEYTDFNGFAYQLRCWPLSVSIKVCDWLFADVIGQSINRRGVAKAFSHYGMLSSPFSVIFYAIPYRFQRPWSMTHPLDVVRVGVGNNLRRTAPWQLSGIYNAKLTI